MVAMDQRESLRTMFRQARGGRAIDDGTLTDFKVVVARALTPFASAFLVDRQFGLEAVLDSGALDSRCALIVAADDLVQAADGPVEDTRIDAGIDPVVWAGRGAAALKLLVIWRDDAQRAARRAMAAEFARRCHAAGLLALIEGVVRAADRERAIVEAARDLGEHADIYKAEVPLRGQATIEAIAEHGRAITEVLACPWVVLSQGVTIDAFPRAVEGAMRGGASGFLAGRAIWSDALAEVDPAAHVAGVSADRLHRLAAIVDDGMKHGR
jgi:sulfofructosephosphate aldolase